MMGDSSEHRGGRPLVPKVAGNPEGKGNHAFLTDWCATEPRGVVAKPQRRSNRGMLRGLAMVVIVMMLFKGFLHAQLGASAYQSRIDALAAGNAIEKAGSHFMVADPITLWISATVVSLVR